MNTILYLIRHSVKLNIRVDLDHAVFDRIQPLSALGEQRAAALLQIDELRHADAAYASPFSRTISTLRYLLEEDKLTLQLDERLRELEFGAMPDVGPSDPTDKPKKAAPPTHAEYMDQRPKPGAENDIRARQWKDHDLAAEGGESIRQCRERMTAAMTDIAKQNPGKKVLVGSHGAAIGSFLTGYYTDLEDDFIRNIGQPDIFRLTYDHDFCLIDATRIPTGLEDVPHHGHPQDAR